MKIESEGDFKRWFIAQGWKRFALGQHAVIIDTSAASRLPVGHPDVVLHAYDDEKDRCSTFYIEMKWVHKKDIQPKHPFTKAQLSMMSALKRVGVNTWGLIGCKETNSCIVLSMPENISKEILAFFDHMTFESLRTSTLFSLEIALS